MPLHTRLPSSLGVLLIASLAVLAVGCGTVYGLTVSIDGQTNAIGDTESRFSKEELDEALSIVSQTASSFGLGQVPGNAPGSPKDPYRDVALFAAKKVEQNQEVLFISVKERADGSELRVSVNDFSENRETRLDRGIINVLHEKLSSAFPKRRISITHEHWRRDFFAP